MKKNKKGFTLVEIIVVLLILAILAAISLPTIVGYVKESKKSEYYPIGRNVSQEASTYYQKQIVYNPDEPFEDLVADMKANLSYGTSNQLSKLFNVDIPNDFKLRSVDLCFDNKFSDNGWAYDSTKKTHKITKVSIWLAKYDPKKPQIMTDSLFVVILPNKETYVYDSSEAWDYVGKDEGPIISR